MNGSLGKNVVTVCDADSKLMMIGDHVVGSS
jgi:hypothetical protein